MNTEMNVVNTSSLPHLCHQYQSSPSTDNFGTDEFKKERNGKTLKYYETQTFNHRLHAGF